jgi:pimeloyl-ACP methyl ester carboxylesterase
MNMTTQTPVAEPAKSCVIALHCSLGSGRQWAALAEELGSDYQMIAPDISGYGDNPGPLILPTSLAEEVELLGDRLREANGPIHLVGHSYGGAVAFKIATDSPFVSRVRSLTLIEPALPTILLDNAKDRRLHERFVDVAHAVYEDLWNGSYLEAIDKFTAFWNGSGPTEPLSAKARIRMIEHVEKLAFDFTAALHEENISAAAGTIAVPTLLFSGGLSPHLTQRIAERLASVIAGVETRHLPTAGHMMPVSHASIINSEIIGHLARADELANVSLACGQPSAEIIDLAGMRWP